MIEVNAKHKCFSTHTQETPSLLTLHTAAFLILPLFEFDQQNINVNLIDRLAGRLEWAGANEKQNK